MPAKLFFIRTERDAGHVLFNDHARDAFGAVFTSADHGDIDLVRACAGDELLGAIEHIVIAILARAGFERPCIGATAGLGQAIACHMFHRDKLGQIFGLYRIAAKTVDHPCGHIVDRDKGRG